MRRARNFVWKNRRQRCLTKETRAAQYGPNTIGNGEWRLLKLIFDDFATFRRRRWESPTIRTLRITQDGQGTNARLRAFFRKTDEEIAGGRRPHGPIAGDLWSRNGGLPHRFDLALFVARVGRKGFSPLRVLSLVEPSRSLTARLGSASGEPLGNRRFDELCRRLSSPLVRTNLGPSAASLTHVRRSPTPFRAPLSR